MFPIKGKRINLILPTLKDVEGIMKHINDRQIAKFIDNLPHPYKRKDGVYFVKKIVHKGVAEKTDYPLSIYEKQHKEIIGGIGLHHLSKEHKHAEVGYWIGRKYWKQGYGTEALQLALKFGFGRLKLNKIYARVYEPNSGSAKLLKKTGFKHEGLFRKHLFKHNKWYNEVRFGLLREEYDKQK